MQQPQRSSLLLIALIIFSFSFGSQKAMAGKVHRVKGKKVYVKLSAKEAKKIKKGDRLYVTTKSGKKRGWITVRKKKGKLAIAQMGKGTVAKGMLTRKKGSKKKRRRKKKKLQPMDDASEVAETEPSESDRSDMMLGIMGSFGTASQSVAGIADMDGSTTGVKGVFDYDLFSSLGVRARLGIEQLSVTGSDASNNDYETIISYVTIDLLLRYYLYRGNSVGFFLNGGMGIYSPMSTDLKGGVGNEGAIQEDSISTTSLLIFGGGVSFPFSGWEIFLGADYLYFPPSDDVDTTVINGKIGLMFEI